MTIFEKHKEFYDQPIHLSEEQKQNPVQVMEDFFSEFDLYVCRELLSEWLECAITFENDQFATARQRSTIVFFSRKLEDLLETAFVLCREIENLNSRGA